MATKPKYTAEEWAAKKAATAERRRLKHGTMHDKLKEAYRRLQEGVSRPKEAKPKPPKAPRLCKNGDGRPVESGKVCLECHLQEVRKLSKIRRKGERDALALKVFRLKRHARLTGDWELRAEVNYRVFRGKMHLLTDVGPDAVWRLKWRAQEQHLLEIAKAAQIAKKMLTEDPKTGEDGPCEQTTTCISTETPSTGGGT